MEGQTGLRMISSAIDRLRVNILLENLSGEEFSYVLPRLREQLYKSGETIVEDETEAQGVHLILEGRVKLTRRTKFGGEFRLALLHPGDFFGEVSLIDGRPNSERATAVDDCTTYVLPKRDFDKLLAESHPFALRLLLVTSIRFRSQNNHFIQELERTTDQFATEVRRLEQVVDTSTVINSTLDLDELLKLILEIALKIVDADSGRVYILDEVQKELWSKVLKGSERMTIRLPLGKGIAGYVAATGDTLNIPDAYLDPRFNPEIDSESGYHTESILCMPMRDKNSKIVGVIQVLNKQNGAFSPEDENAVNALSTHAALAIEKAWLYEVGRGKIALEKELSAARSVQVGLLPRECPSIDGYEFSATLLPAKSVGGDFYDFVTLDDGKVALSLGHVSGKGMAAALLMANVQATVRAYSTLNTTPETCVRQSNELLFNSTAPEKFATLLYGVLDSKRNAFHYTNAGHENPLFFRKWKDPYRLEVGGVPLGMVENFPYEEGSVEFRRGDILIMFSDGIRDAVDSAGKKFGAERIEKIVRKSAGLPAKEISEKILYEVRAHISETPQFDDMTLLIVKRSG